MIIRLASLKDAEPKHLSESLDPATLDLEYVDLHYKTKIAVDGTAEKALNTLTFRGTVSRAVEHVCARCLKTDDESIAEHVDFVYEINGRTEIDLTDDIRDVLLLSHPDRYLCTAECKGLCQGCGANLNSETCRCQQRVV